MLPVIRVGELNRKLGIYNPTASTDEYGTVEHTYSHVGWVWGKLRTLSADEQLIAEGMEAVTTHEITCQYMTAINSRSQLHYGSRVFEINAIEDTDDAHVVLVLTCREVRD